MARIHFKVPRHTTPVGYYVNTACGAYVTPAVQTTNRDEVTCRSCQRTALVREGAQVIGGKPGRKDKRPRDRSGYKQAWAPGGARRAALEAKQREDQT